MAYKEMKKLLTLIGISLLFSGCMTKLNVNIPYDEEREIKVEYSYPIWQEKFVTYERTENGVKIDFRSKSDPLVDAMQTIQNLSDKVPVAP